MAGDDIGHGIVDGIVDLRNASMVKHVAVPYVPVTVKIVPNVNRLAAAVCRTGDKVFWLKHTSMSKLRTLGTTTSAC